MTNRDKRRLARELYINTDLNRKQIATQVGCTEKTLRGWIEQEDWESIKEAQSITRSQLLNDAYRQLKAINKRIDEEMGGVPNKELSDAKGVLRKEIEALTDSPLHVYIDVMDEFTRWILANYPGKLKQMAELCNEFIEERAKREGM